MQAVYGAAASKETFGFYGSAYVDITKSKSSQTSELSMSVASNLISGQSLSLSSLSLSSGSGDINITGSKEKNTKSPSNKSSSQYFFIKLLHKKTLTNI